MKPVLYRYRDSESVITPMDGYTPGDGWVPLYSQDQVDQLQAQLVRQQESYEAEIKVEIDAALERAEKACEEEAADIRSEGKGCHTGQYDHMADGAGRCAQAIRALKEKP